MRAVLIAGVLVVVVGLGQGANDTCQTPGKLPAGGKWVPDEGCTHGTVYLTLTQPRQRCHCWSHCGYICEPASSGGGGGGSVNATTTKPSSTKPTTSKATTSKPAIN